MEDWKYHNTYSGTPQGGIISPLLANIYLNELDKYVMQLKREFDRPSEQVAKIKTMFKDGHGRWGIPYETKSGKKRCYFANYHDCKDSKNGNDTVSKAYVINAHSITTLESRVHREV